MAIDRTVKFTVRLNMLNPAHVTINKVLNELNLDIFKSTTLIISKKPRNTGKLRDRDTEFTTDLLHSDRALTRCSFP